MRQHEMVHKETIQRYLYARNETVSRFSIKFKLNDQSINIQPKKPNEKKKQIYKKKDS